MELEKYIPVWEKLTAQERAALSAAASERFAEKGTLLHSGEADCVGLFVVRSGQLRAFITSPDGREMTIYRLFERDICLFSAACMLPSLQLSVSVEAGEDSELIVIQPDVYRAVMASSAALANYTNELMASRLSEVMWLIEQLLWKSTGSRLAAFLLDESALQGTDTLKITHEKIAAHLGTAREVVTRLLKYFHSEGMVALSRGGIVLTDKEKLSALAA